MFLKKLEVYGFKSFADKLTFEFQKGITGIVGPNGSGKSNISDAIRWVLGEQSAKQLRGAKMEDVIFAGTEVRKPVGFASVAITFDNTDRFLPIDYDEVTVSRRVFRSGESEYKINGGSCRLKDIEELFYDTGIGQDGYSIIGQGQVDKILSGKSDERRELFDEAAGIVKYKRRKNKALKDLKHEEENLLRAGDILSELEDRVGPLKEQEEKARKYLSLRDELKVYDCTSFILQSDKVRGEIVKVESDIKIAENDLRKANEEYDSIRKKYENSEKEKEEIAEKEKQLLKIGDELKEIISEINTSHIVIEEKKRNINERLEEICVQKSETENKIPLKFKEIEKTDSEYRETEGVVSSGESKLNELIKKKDIYDKELIDYELNQKQLHNMLLDNVNKREAKKFAVSNLEYKIKSYDDMIADSITESDEREKNRKIAENLIRKCEEEIKEHNNQLGIIERDKADVENKYRNTESDISKLKNDLYNKKTKLGYVKSEFNSIKNISERYEGYTRSIRRVMELKDSIPGIIGVVADIIKTSDRYELAIETALGSRLQNIVTETDASAKKLVEILKKEKAGRATFLPLSNIVSRKIDNKLKGEEGVIGYAYELVEYDSKYSELIRFLFRSTIVCDNIDNALRLQKRNGQTLSIVTVDGESLSPGGAITGGSFKHNDNLLSRNRLLEEKEQAITQLTKDIEKLEKDASDKENESLTLKNELNELNTKLMEAQVKNNSLNNNLEIARKQYTDIENDSNNSKSSDDLKVELDKLKIQLSEEKKMLETLINKEAEINAKAKENDKNADKARAKLNDLNDQINDYKLEYKSGSQKGEFLKQTLDRLIGEKKAFESELESLINTECILRNELEQKDNDKEKSSVLLAERKEELNSVENEIIELTKKKEVLEKSHHEFINLTEEVVERRSTIDTEIYRLTSKKERLNSQIEEFTNYMWEEYELTYSYAKENFNSEFTDLDEINKSSRKIRNEIKSLGNINVNAIEEYKEVSERYEFYKTQHDDLVKATHSLMGVISDLDKGMRKQFANNFEIIRNKFKATFKELFGGGNADVVLDDSEDILEADIIITAQPPGKKLTNMMQLSGGEKALTAISLLFAIQALNPSAFCILDEIEAALDDANVERFALYLRNLADNTQYVVITHRRGTMTASDRLYGITMQEKGVSTIVSVELDK